MDGLLSTGPTPSSFIESPGASSVIYPVVITIQKKIYWPNMKENICVFQVPLSYMQEKVELVFKMLSSIVFYSRIIFNRT